MLSKHHWRGCTLLVLACTLALGSPVLADCGRSAEAERAFQRFAQARGPGWQAVWDDATGHVRMLYGSVIPSPEVPDSEGRYRGLATRYLTETEGLFAFRGNHLAFASIDHLRLDETGARDKVAVHFTQRYRNLEVHGGSVVVLMKPDGSLLEIDSRAVELPVGFVTTPRLEREHAQGVARDVFAENLSDPGDLQVASELVIYPSRQSEGCGTEPRLAWMVEVMNADVVDHREWMLVVSADTAQVEILANWDRESGATVLGNVSGSITEDWQPHSCSSNPPSLTVPIVGTKVWLDASGSCGAGVSAVTDDDGDFSYTNPGTRLYCVDLTNNDKDFWVLDDTYSPLSLTGIFTYDVPKNLVFDTDPCNDASVQLNGYHWTDKVIEYANTYSPTLLSSNPSRLLVKVNDPTACNNAFFSPSNNRVRFGATAPGCANMAFSTIIGHEEGHWLNYLNDSAITSSAYYTVSEGLASSWSMYITDRAVIGESLSDSLSGINDFMFCGDTPQPPTCNSGVAREEGQVLMGVLWNIKDSFLFLDGASSTAADSLFVSWLRTNKPREIKEIMETQLLQIDDDDENLANGSPSYHIIDKAFRDKGFPGVEGFMQCYVDQSSYARRYGIEDYPLEKVSDCLERTISEPSSGTPEIFIASGTYTESTASPFTISKPVILRVENPASGSVVIN